MKTTYKRILKHIFDTAVLAVLMAFSLWAYLWILELNGI
jgi:hypothetical protein